jgi:hypothetical protein
MRDARKRLVAVTLASVGLMVGPAFAVAANPHANGHGSTGPTGSTGATSSNGHAYGVLCAKESRTHVAGQKGTPFSQCVTALAKLSGGSTTNPATACAGESRKHVKGEHGTPFSRCVAAAAKLRGQATGSTGASGSTGA